MAKLLIHVGPEDDVADLAGKLQAAGTGDEIALTVEPGAQAFQTPLNVRLLRSVAMKRGLTTSIVSPDPRIQEVALSAGLPVYSSVAALESGVRVESPRPGFRSEMPPPRPQAPFLPRPSGTAPGAAMAAETPPFEYVPRSLTTPASAGADPPVIPQAADPVLPGAPPIAPGAVPPPRTGPWGAPIVTPRSPAPPEPVAPATPTAFAPTPQVAAPGFAAPPPRGPLLPASPAGPPPRPGSPWASLSEIPEDDEPVSPWAAARSAAAASPGAIGATTVSPAPPTRTPLPAPLTAPSGRGQPPTRPPISAAGRLRLPSRRVIYGVVVGVLALGVILFLLLGTSATVTIAVTEQPLTVTPTIQGTTSTVEASQPNYILSKQITDTASQTFPASPTGTQNVTAVAATTKLQLTTTDPLCSSGCSPLLVQEGTAFATADNSAIFSVSQDTYVSFTSDGLPGSPEVPVVDLSAGTAGNSIPAGAIDACAPGITLCSQLDISVTNPAPPTGGVDAATETVASASDIANWQEELGQIETQLGQKATADLTAKAGQEKVAVDPNGGGKSITFAVSPSSFPPTTPGTVLAPETVTVTMTAQETVYNPSDLDAVVLKDLEASSNLPAGDSLVPAQLQLNNLQIIQAGSDGSFALSVSAVDYYHGKVDISQLGGELTGRNPQSVKGIVEQAIPDVQSVTVDETPIETLFMPFSSSSIHIVETFATSGSGSSASG
jgi:hypothetical protein